MSWEGMWKDENYKCTTSLGNILLTKLHCPFSITKDRNLFSKLKGSVGWTHTMVYKKQQPKSPFANFSSVFLNA